MQCSETNQKKPIKEMEKQNAHAARLDRARSRLSKYKNVGDDADRGSADEALRKSEERYKAIFEGVGDGIICANRRARVIDVNPAFTWITGIPREEVVGKSGFRLARRFAGLKDVPKLIQALRQALKGEPIGLYELEINNKIVEVSTPVLKKESPGIIGVIRDISDRRHAEEALRESEQRFRRIFENSLVGMYRTTPDGRIVMANAALLRMLGYSSFEELAARNLEQHGYDPDYPRSEFKRRIEADGRIIGLESTWRRRDGTTLFARESAQAIRDNAGNILYYEGTVSDITKGKLAEKKLRESEEKYRSVIENANIGILVIQEGKHVFYNSKIHEMLGYTAQEFEEMDYVSLIHPADRTFVSERIRQRLEGVAVESDIVEIRLRSKSGETKWIQVNSSVIRWKGWPALQSFLVDVTERKKAEAALRESERNLSLAQEIAHIGSWRYDVKTGQDHWSGELFRIYGLDPEENKPSLDRRIGMIHPDDKAFAEEALNKAVKKNLPYQMEYRIIRPDGEERFVEGIGRVENDQDGDVWTVFGTDQDITERRRAEENLRLHSLAIGQIQDLVTVTDLDGSITYINDAACRMLGKPREELIGQHISIFGEDASKGATQEEILRKTRQEGQWRGEIVNIRTGGSATILDCRTYLVRDDAGQPMALCGISTDVTERKRAEEELQKRKNFLRDIFNGIQDGINVIDRDFTIIKVNQWIEKKYPEDMHLVGRKCYEVYQRRETVCPWCPAVKTLSTGEVYVEHIKVPSKNGSFWWCEFSTYPLKDQNNHVIGVLGHKKNINERKRAENALKESEGQLKQAQEVAHVGSWYLDLRTSRLTWSDETYRIFGVPIGRPLVEADFLAFVHPDDVDCVEASWAAALQGGPYDVEHRIFMGKTIKWVREKAQLEFDAENKPISGIGTVQDITELKKAESELRKYQEKLKAMASDILQTEERERRRLAIGLHDDICQRLVLSKLTLESSLRSSSDAKLTASLQMTAETLGETIRKAESLTFELSNPVLREFGFVPALEEYLATEIHDKHGIAFELDADKRSVSLRDDVNACLYRSMRELLNNVVKHAQARKVWVSVHHSQDEIRIIVQDDGIGFEPVKVREEDSRTIRFGLFSIREQLEHLGGGLLIESKPGRGTVATIVVGKISRFMQERMGI